MPSSCYTPSLRFPRGPPRFCLLGSLTWWPLLVTVERGRPLVGGCFSLKGPRVLFFICSGLWKVKDSKGFKSFKPLRPLVLPLGLWKPTRPSSTGFQSFHFWSASQTQRPPKDQATLAKTSRQVSLTLPWGIETPRPKHSTTPGKSYETLRSA